MRALATVVAVGLVVTAPALAAAQTPSTAAPPAPPANAVAMPPESTAAVTSSTTPPSAPTASAPSAGAAGTNAQATAGAANQVVAVGDPVKDNTGTTIGAVTRLNPGAGGQQMAVIKMGTESFQAPTDRLGVANGVVTINMTQAQIQKMLHPAAGGR